ncbi:hypothetical protein HYY73_02525 [Candidatus Woesearchaeota archaeon]|nr:hypothetical protein [Candidatus Woesearchaeota archaeon]
MQRITGADIYFDPKGMPKAEIAWRFKEAVSYAREHNLTHLLKTGWGYFQRQPQPTLPTKI